MGLPSPCSPLNRIVSPSLASAFFGFFPQRSAACLKGFTEREGESLLTKESSRFEGLGHEVFFPCVRQGRGIQKGGGGDYYIPFRIIQSLSCKAGSRVSFLFFPFLFLFFRDF
ncbi:hypothetical protein IE53DRAFT_217072 [Violaceomyces palustris]|uniref:Uncharacterized protein n=1 Tax=Violaceomyces palustris TaxID=1673888 RepID=A0ACD0P4Q8_9BASI|nr:hypothetical protein IE53DRAFT_217072 [Violaceomyces palustris]